MHGITRTKCARRALVGLLGLACAATAAVTSPLVAAKTSCGNNQVPLTWHYTKHPKYGTFTKCLDLNKTNSAIQRTVDDVFPAKQQMQALDMAQCMSTWNPNLLVSDGKNFAIVGFYAIRIDLREGSFANAFKKYPSAEGTHERLRQAVRDVTRIENVFSVEGNARLAKAMYFKEHIVSVDFGFRTPLAFFANEFLDPGNDIATWAVGRPIAGTTVLAGWGVLDPSCRPGKA
jgi:hypothetical protein